MLTHFKRNFADRLGCRCQRCGWMLTANLRVSLTSSLAFITQKLEATASWALQSTQARAALTIKVGEWLVLESFFLIIIISYHVGTFKFYSLADSGLCWPAQITPLWCVK